MMDSADLTPTQFKFLSVLEAFSEAMPVDVVAELVDVDLALVAVEGADLLDDALQARLQSADVGGEGVLVARGPVRRDAATRRTPWGT